MPGDKKSKKRKEVGDLSYNKKCLKKKQDKRLKLKPKSQENSFDSKYSRKRGADRTGEGKGKGNAFRRKTIVKKAILQKKKSLKKHPSSRKAEHVIVGSGDGIKLDGSNGGSQKVKRRRKRRRKGNVELDEASRLQRRTRYLLIKVKLEQNLIDAYSGEGWKGQSREKIRPEKELDRAKKQILKCKLGIREVIRQLDLLSSEGRIDDSAVAPDGSVYHEHIICAKCKLREAFPDNDIILCDGTCNCAFHQKCLDPPLSTENIPPEDEGWFCRYCKSKMEILEATNAHLGTNFAIDSNWQDIFTEEAMLPDGEESSHCQEQEWPSDDSEDIDYDPEIGESSCNNSMAGSESDASVYANSSSSLRSLEDDAFFLLESPEMINMEYQDDSAGGESDGATDCEVLSQPRQRKTVDYIKLNYELFGRNAPLSEQISEDEEWGPSKRKQRTKESNAVTTAVDSGENESYCTEEKTAEVKKKLLSGKIKRSIYRFPHDVVEKLRVVFAENELPSRTTRENLSKELGLECEKVNKWFKNARYLALKARKKAKRSSSLSPGTLNESASGSRNEKPADHMPLLDALEMPKGFKSYCRREITCCVTSPLKRKKQKMAQALLPTSSKASVDFADDVSLKLLRDKVKKKKKKKKFSSKRRNKLEAEAEMERLCRIKDKLEKLQQVLMRLPNGGFGKADAALYDEPSIVYVPVAELREKA